MIRGINSFFHHGENAWGQCRISSLTLLLGGEQQQPESHSTLIHGFSNYSCLSCGADCQQWLERASGKTLHTLTFLLPLAWPGIHQMGLGQGGLKFIQHFWEKHTTFSPPKRRIFKCCYGSRKKWKEKKKGLPMVSLIYCKNSEFQSNMLSYIAHINIRWARQFVFITVKLFQDTCSRLSLSCVG